MGRTSMLSIEYQIDATSGKGCDQMRIKTLVPRALLITTIAVVVASSACAYVAGGAKKTLDEILALPAGDFKFGVWGYTREAIEKDDKSALPGLWKLFDRALKERQPKGYPSELGSVTEAIGLLGSDADLERLLRYYDSEKSDYVRFSAFLIPMSNICVRRELEQVLSSAPLEPLPLDEGAKLPDRLKNASPELHNAWLQYETIRRRLEPLVRPRTSPVSATRQEGLAELYKIIGSLLRGNSRGTTDQIAGFYWASMCGTFSDSLDGPKYLGMFMGLLKERRYHEALGALLAFERESDHHPTPAAAKAEFEWKRRFIAFCG